ncbi:MAG: carboxymuconolactone decarboxylase family protein [Granulosicoccus sp.]
MSRLPIRTASELQPETIQALEPVRLNGKISDVYLQFANSQVALRAYLHMEQSLREGSLTITEIEAVKLWVSQQTGCNYCLSIHSFKAGQAGLSPEKQMAVRAGRSTGDGRVDTLLKVASTVYESPGSIPQALLDEARGVGLTDENLVDLMMAISTVFFTNLTNHINDTQSPLPPAPVLV